MGFSQKIIKRCGWKCYYCHRAVIQPTGPEQADNTATIDHLIPIAMGGIKMRSSRNCVIACFACNNAKSDRTVDDIVRDGWKPGYPVKKREVDMLLLFRSISMMHSQKQVMRKSYRLSFSALQFALMNHVDILA